MDTPSVIREFLDENRVSATRSVEIAYRYHAELEPGCRLNGCEMIMRSIGEEVLVRAELPVNVMTKESGGVVKYLADLNKKRVGEGKQGYFDLDYVAGKIVFAIRVRQPITTDILKEVSRYCIDQIEYESDDLLKVVCDECESVLQEEEELRQQRAKNMRGSGLFGSLIWRFRNWIDDITGLGGSRRRGSGDDDVYMDYDYDYGADDRAGSSYRPRHAYRPKSSIFDMDDEDEGYSAGNQEERGSVKRPGYGWREPDEENVEDEDDETVDPMSDEEFAEFVRKHFHTGEDSDGGQSEDDDDVIYAGSVEEDETGKAQPEEEAEPQSEEKPDEKDEEAKADE